MLVCSIFRRHDGAGTDESIAECNNAECFPGIGLGAILSRARLTSDRMLIKAGEALASLSPALKDPDKALLPDVADARKLSLHIAIAVIKAAVEEGLAQAEGIPSDDKELEAWVKAQMWEPVYRDLKLVQPEAGRHAQGELGVRPRDE